MSGLASSHSARLPCTCSRASSLEKSHVGRCLPSSEPKRVEAMRHVLFMKGSFKKVAAAASVTQPSHLPSEASPKRCCAKSPS